MDNQEFQMMLPMGARLQGGRYQVERYLSSGGFGNTYVVTRPPQGQRFAMKEFFMKGVNHREGDSTLVSVSNPANGAQFKAQLDKFKKEAERLQQLAGDHIVKVHSLFEENGTAYYVMDFVDGESLSERLKRTGRPLTEDEVMPLVTQVLDALDEVHRLGIWHLDLKPGNIMVDRQGQVKVIDFGASKQISVSGGYSSTTNSMCYTPGFAPSEQMDQNIERIGPWTDLYALGATIYNLVTNQAPPAVSELQEPGAFVFPEGVSQRTRNLVFWMMDPSRGRRPQCVADVRYYLATGNIPMAAPPSAVAGTATVVGNAAQTVASAAAGTATVVNSGPVSQPPVSRPAGLSRGAKRFIVGLVALLLIGGIGYFVWTQVKSHKTEMLGGTYDKDGTPMERLESLLELLEQHGDDWDVSDYEEFLGEFCDVFIEYLESDECDKSDVESLGKDFRKATRHLGKDAEHNFAQAADISYIKKKMKKIDELARKYN